MKVRDIQRYLEGYCPTSSISQLGTDQEPFLEKIYGWGQRIEPTITNVASFAKDSEEQLFYEFVQNAFDANADDLCFFFDKEFLIVLNNGEPFYTDPISDNPRDGQLYNFLAKGKSLKAGDDSKSGEFGQGSKLLYTLIADKGAASNNSLLIRSIKEQKKGPYIVSWGSPSQLDNFRLQSTDGWTYTDPYKDNPDLLVCKILMTYYPIAPGIDKELFSRKEFHQIREGFERLVDPKRHINRLGKGTAIIIPLGEGQYEAIAAEDNLKKVMTRLAGFAALTADIEKNQGRKLDHIYVNGQEVEMQHTVQSLFVKFNLPEANESFSYQFAFNPVFAKDSAVTLFKTLPITEARYRLGFIIDSPNFEHDSSRQRINDTKKTGLQLKEAFRHLLNEIKLIQTKNKEQFDYIYDSLMASQTPKNDDTAFIRTPFFETFKPFIQDNVRTTDGTYLPMQRVRRPDIKDIVIPLERIGINQYRWISEDIDKERKLGRFGIDVESLSLREIIDSADSEKLSGWIKSLSREEYGLLHADFLRLSKDDADIANKALFLTNKGNVYSLKQLIYPMNPVLLYDERFGHSCYDRCLDIEYPLGPFSYVSPDRTVNIGTINIGKIICHCDFYREDDARTDVACRTIIDSRRFPRTETAIKENILLFKRLDGLLRPFGDLMFRKPDGTILFDSFCVTGFGHDILPEDLFISSPVEIWNWLQEHLKELTDLPDWAEQHQHYLNDIVSVFEKAGSPAERITLSLDENGIPTPKQTFLLRSDNRLNNEQYELVSMFAETKDYPLVSYPFKKTLSSPPFETPSVSINEILEEGATVDERLLGCIVTLAESDILKYFKVSAEGDGHFRIVKLDRGKNYTCAIQSEDIQNALATINYSPISPEVSRYFDNAQLAKFEITRDYNMMESILNRIDHGYYPVLLPAVRDHHADIIQLYLDGLPILDISDTVDEDNNTWQVISFILSKIATNDNYRQNIFKLVRYKGQSLPDSIKSNIVHFNGTDYDLYKLIGEVQTENEIADGFLSCIPDPQRFRTIVWSGNQESKSADEVYDELYDNYLDVEQLRFCLDYSIVNHCDYHNLEINHSVSLSDALDMISAYGFAGFDQYFKMEDFDKEIQVYAPAELLIEDEYLPKAVSDWIAKDPERAHLLLKGINTESLDYIAIRSALKKGEAFTSMSWLAEDEGRLYRTINWIFDQHFSILQSISDNRYSVLRTFLDRLPEDIDRLPGLRFTGTFAKDQDGLSSQVLTFEYFAQDGALLTFDNVYLNAAQIESKPKLKQFFLQNRLYGYDGTNFLMKQNLNDCTRYYIRTTAELKDGYEEWGAKVYNQWKESDESEGIRIFLSQHPVGITLFVADESTGRHAVDITSSSDLFGHDSINKFVIIQHPNPESLTEMKTLERVAKAALFFKDPFISLQSIYVEMVESGIDPNALDENEQKAVEMANKLGKDALDKINDNLDTVKEIVEGLTEDELKIVAENKDKIQNLLEEIPVDDESMQSKVRKTIGYIGELIYKIYLENNNIDFDYAAARGVGDYDFKLMATAERPALYVDVKTNLYSFKEESVPFYIHKSQNRFMQLHPDEPFRIVRISLTDLDLNQTYEHIRDFFGAEADYELNPELKARCEKVARDYWKSARIEEFDAASPEYGIKIERLPRE